MKKIFTLIGIAAVSTVGFAQTQRMVLAEEFTNASCGPCASQNPTFNTLMDNNTTKVVSLKYQTNWPGTDPMNAQTQADVGPRVTYYGVSGVPFAPMDGDTTPVMSPSYAGAPANWNQTKINTRYAVTSPFSINLTHTMSADFDSIFITAVVTAAQNATFTGPLKLHVALIEKEIIFATAPGTNGEKEFYNVMRKMYPNSSGTTLVNTWTNAQSQTFTFNRALPTYIYNKSQLAVVAFIQDNSDKEVQQSAITNPIAVPNDAGATAISSLPLFQCTSSISPVATIKNMGTTTLTSATVKYQIDAGTIDSVAWTGSLAPGATTTVSLPAVSTTAGSHTLKVYTVNPNGITDYNAGNNTTTKAFNIIGSSVMIPLVQDFQQSTFPPAGWMKDNPDNGPTWTRKTGAGGFLTGSTQACAKMDFYNSPAGSIDDLLPPAFDLSGLSAPINLVFHVAYAGYTSSSPETDRLEVLYSTDCGTTWTSIFNKAGNTLKTANPTTSAFTPTAAQWRTESVNLDALAGQSQVLMKFKATSDYGNNLYVDNINISNTPTSIQNKNTSDEISIYPNPSSGNPNLVINLSQTEKVRVELYNLVGELLSVPMNTQLGTGEHKFVLETASLPSGIYCVKISKGSETITKKITLSK